MKERERSERIKECNTWTELGELMKEGGTLWSESPLNDAKSNFVKN